MPKRSPAYFSITLARFTAGLVVTTMTLSATLSLTLPVAVTLDGGLRIGTQSAHAANGRASSQRSNSKLIVLLIASSREENPARAIELLGQAREELQKENLATEDNIRILAMIEDLEAKARTRIERTRRATTADRSALSTITPMLPTVTDLGSLGANGTGLTTREVESLLSTNPELRDALWQIGRGRLSRDVQNLDAIITEKTGKTPKQIDDKAATDLAEAYKPGAFLELLRKAGIVKYDFTKANLQLKQEYDGTALSVIADQLTRDAMKFTMPAGFLQGTLSDFGFGGRFFGLSQEAVLTFSINTNLALQISDLYSVELSESEKEVVLLVIVTVAKIASRNGPGAAKSMMTSLGENLGRMKTDGKAGAVIASLQKLLGTPAVAAIAGPAIAGGQLVTPADTAKAATPVDAAAKPGKLAPLKAIAGRINFSMWLKSGLFAARSGAETYAIGQAADWLFSSMHKTKRKIQNESFRRFLMTPTGEGFSKLLILAMNDGVPSAFTAPATTPNTATANAQMKAKLDFIVNIARSARTCLDDDLKSLSMPSAPAVAAYACQANPNTDRFNRLKNEILTFNEIPQDYVADLRIVSRDHRLRMADLVLQMQFIDGDRSPSETEFFRNVVAKSLGVDGREDLEYFERLHSFIQERGGLVRSSSTPTGFMIRTDAKAHPFNMEQGYTPLNAPAAPQGERYLAPIEKK